MLTFPNDYCPLLPTARQRVFLVADELEVFFGGAAGGGKSLALLMAALQYVDTPGYAALILRKDTQRLALAGGLIPRSHEWLAACGDACWNAARRQWSFPTSGAPATITFGYLATELDKFRYASSEFQLIAFDELTELPEADYLFLFSRLRRNLSVDVPLRMRSASNPGNIGHLWVKQRFVQQKCESTGVQEYESVQDGDPASATLTLPHSQTLAPPPDRRFIPSRLADNPHLDAQAYRRSLLHLLPIERERLLAGDWNIQEKALIRPDWLRYYTLTRRASEGVVTRGVSEGTSNLDTETLNIEPGTLNLLGPDGRLLAAVDSRRCRRFVTVDPAGTSADRAQEVRGRSPSHTVAQVWDQPRGAELSRLLILRHQVRGLLGYPEIVHMLRELHAAWRPERIWIEDEKLGRAIDDDLKRELPIDLVATGSKDKAARATRLVRMFEEGRVFLPSYENSWRHAFESELLSWTGSDQEPADQIDAAAYAAIVAQNAAPGIIIMQPIVAR